MGLRPEGDPARPLQPVLRWLDPATGSVEDALVRPPPRDLHPPGDDAEFTGAHRVGDRLWQATRTEVLVLQLPDLTPIAAWSHPLFHDVHDGLPLADGGLAVTATGLDAIVVLNSDHSVREVVRMGTIDPALHADWRQVAFHTTKPRSVHPNHLVWLGDALWTSSLERPGLHQVRGGGHVPIVEGPTHDGRVIDGELWLTTITGVVVALDPTTLTRTRTLDLRALDPRPGVRGWCRGIEKVGSRLFVGFSTLRASATREQIGAWLRGPKGPTCVVELDLDSRRVVATHEVGNAAGGTLYAIHAWPSEA